MSRSRDDRDFKPTFVTPKLKAPPVATIGELMSGSTKWFWIHCNNTKCLHYAPAAVAPFAIRFGLEASSDLIRQKAKCSKCGHVGVSLCHPSFVDMVHGFQPFPT